jgi:quercetin dioxygenase-like cupin family protein
MTDPLPRIVSPEQRPSKLNVAGIELTVLASFAETQGYEIFHQRGPAGKGPGKHYHPWDESFYVIEGEVICGVGELESTATAGTLVHIPAGSIHWYRFGDAGGEIISMTSQGNASAMYEAFDREGSWGETSRERVIALSAEHGQSVVTGE